jgi:hypothetical protein
MSRRCHRLPQSGVAAVAARGSIPGLIPISPLKRAANRRLLSLQAYLGEPGDQSPVGWRRETKELEPTAAVARLTEERERRPEAADGLGGSTIGGSTTDGSPPILGGGSKIHPSPNCFRIASAQSAYPLARYAARAPSLSNPVRITTSLAPASRTTPSTCAINARPTPCRRTSSST